ncbi:MAG: cytochrome c3 family protein [Chthoniobacterales bacterium]|nr:cytochrome c3 family protein [Chthoniobacterales bacterium]
MANFFPKWTNWTPLKVVICLGVLGTAVSGGMWYYFTPKYTRVGYMPTQPVPYSHAIHVEQLGMDCRYCHSYVEVASHSNVPTTQTCMACHTQIRANSPKLEAVRESWKTGQPVNWVRIHKVPDYTYFNHAAHVNRGVSCFSCHGSINEMTTVFQDQPQSMSWCLDCHRAPENHLRPPKEVYNMKWKPPEGETQRQIGSALKAAWEVEPPLTCGGCHR